METEQTQYGWRSTGESKFVIVAPHGAGDDELTELVAEEVARIMDAAAVVNTEYRRESCDLNDISDVTTDQRKQQFFADITQAAEEARQYSSIDHDGEEHALVVYIHGMKDRGDKGIDIGIGAKWREKKGRYQGAEYHPKAVKEDGTRMEGKVRTNIEMARQTRISLDDTLGSEKGRTAGMGKVFAAWDEHNGIQYHAGTEDHSIQIEISRSLREDPEYIAGVIATALQDAYEKL
jgi:phage replication-related protein YjqB (UPF0714/DUF867 family)